jgi:TolB-like protein/Flp pilus assembly protein TadD
MKLLHDLRRRRVFRLAGLYIVGAWVVVQVAEALFQAWGIPETANRFVFIAAALCFPIALVFGWIYDITSEGIVRTRKAGVDESVSMQLQKADYGILAALVAIGVVVLLGSYERIQEEIETGYTAPQSIERRSNSIAVLPFKNLDIHAETGYFSDGITEEILQRLSTLGALHVLSSGSSFSFRDSDQSPAEMSATLGVSYLLDGSIRRSENRIRVTTRLLDADGFQVWTDTYDRELTEIFALQTDIANEVSRQIAAEIVPLEALPGGRTTENMEAYNAYLLGRYEADRRFFGWRGRAEEAFRKAIELDPGFAPPYAGLAILVVNTALGPHWEEARSNAEKSLQLDPDLAEAHAILGLMKTLLDDDPEAGAVSLRHAIDLNPSYSSSYAWLAISLNRQGLSAASREASYRGLEKDPFNPVLIANLADREELAGNFEVAEQLLLRLMRLPQVSGPQGQILSLYHDWGRYADELASFKTIMRKLGADSVGQFPYLARNYAALGMTADASYWLDLSASEEADGITPIDDIYFVSKLFADPAPLRPHLASVEAEVARLGAEERAYLFGYGGLAQIQVGDFAKGIEWLEESLEIYRQAYAPDSPARIIDVSTYDDEWWTWLVVHMFQRLVFAYQQVDRIDDATDILQQLDEVLGQAEPRKPLQHEWHALQYVLRGDLDGAHESLAAAIDLGWANYHEVSSDPAWASALQDERIAALLEIAKDRVTEQRRVVEAEEAEEDFRATVERWLSE